jgi:hypothetical protein
MAGRVGQWVPAVIARVEDDDLKVGEKAPPEADIAVARKAVAVADDQPRPARIAVPPYANDRAVLTRDVDDGEWLQPAISRLRRNWKNSTPSRSRRFIISGLRIISPTSEAIFLRRK